MSNKRYELGLVTLRLDDPRVAAESSASEQLVELVVPAGMDVKNCADLEPPGAIDHPDGQAMAPPY